MYEDAYQILDYLPIDRAGLTEYVDHLWGSFETLIEQDYPVRPFSLFPFHLLSMLAIQYKVFRISAYKTSEYLVSLEECYHRKPDELEILRKNIPLVDPTTGKYPIDASVRNLSFLSERRLFTFLGILGVDEDLISKGQAMVDLRGKYAHANGNIEENLEDKIDAYIDIHRKIQMHMLDMNDDVAMRWLSEIDSDETGKEFIELHLATEYLTPEDMKQGRLSIDIEPRRIA